MQIPLTFLQEDSHASHIPKPGSDSAKQMTDISGQKCVGQLERLNQVGSWAKMFMGLLIGQEGWYSTKCNLTWKLRGTKYSRFYCQLAVSTHPIKDLGSSLLLTPNLVQIAETPEEYQKRQMKRTQQGKNQAPHPNNKYNCLLSQILYSGMLPTPKTQDSRHALMDRGKSNLGEEISQWGQDNGIGSHLSPQFVMEMMGFPTDWTLLPFLNGETNPSKQEATQ